MIIVGSALVSEEIFEEHFVCDLAACKGACCVEGESGAPLLEEELSMLESIEHLVRPYLLAEGIAALQEKGLYERDVDGDWVTPLVGHHGACAYAIFDADGTAKCGIEKAFLDGKIAWQKPISCHLYPIRLQSLAEYTAVNYHRWPICAPACECGSKLQVPVYKFLKSPLTRTFGEEWYTELEATFQVWKAQSASP
jgi:hypothetical protein